jgi:uncharacterized protein YdaT
MSEESKNTENSLKDANKVEDKDSEEMPAKKKLETRNKRVHVIKRDKGWAVKKQGASRASRIYKSKDEAVEKAQKFKKSGHDLVIHKKDGSIQKWEKTKKRKRNGY